MGMVDGLATQIALPFKLLLFVLVDGWCSSPVLGHSFRLGQPDDASRCRNGNAAGSLDDPPGRRADRARLDGRGPGDLDRPGRDQINEATLTFVPKLVVVALVLVILGPSMINSLVEFTQYVFQVASEANR